MKPSTILYATAAFIVAYVVLAPYLPTTFEPCVLGQNINSFCEDTKQLNTPYCHAGGYVAYNRSSCGEDECFFGQCLPTACTQSERICSGNFSYIDRTCANGQYTNSLSFCPSGQVCQGGYCRSGEVNGILSSWDTLYQEVQANPELKDYTACTGVFDCQKQSVQDASNKIMADYDVKTPREYVDAVAEYTYGAINYQLNGGAAQCGESASSFIEHKLLDGNCVDYASVMTTLLRAKGIPARQSGGCLNKGFNCVAFAITPPSLGSIRYGNLNNDQPLAHAWVELYLGEEVGWQIADPTVGQTVSKCLNYNTISPGKSDGQSCYLPMGDYSERCVWS